MGLSEGKKPRTYREKARRKYNSFSKSRKKTVKLIRTTIRQQLGYLNRDLGIIDAYELRHPGCLERIPSRQQNRSQFVFAALRNLYTVFLLNVSAKRPVTNCMYMLRSLNTRHSRYWKILKAEMPFCFSSRQALSSAAIL